MSRAEACGDLCTSYPGREMKRARAARNISDFILPMRFDGFLWDYNGETWTANGAFCLEAFPGNVNGMTELNTVELDVFPNPSAGDQVSLSWPGVEPFADVAVFDLTGRQVAGMTQVSRNESINMDLPPGTYLIKMQTETSTASTQLQVIR